MATSTKPAFFWPVSFVCLVCFPVCLDIRFFQSVSAPSLVVINVVVSLDDVVVLDYVCCLLCVGSWLLFWILQLLFCMLGVSPSKKLFYPLKMFFSVYGLLLICLCSGFILALPLMSVLFLLLVLHVVSVPLFLLFELLFRFSAFPLPKTIVWRARGEKVSLMSCCCGLIFCF